MKLELPIEPDAFKVDDTGVWLVRPT